MFDCQNEFFISAKPKRSTPRSYEENIICVHDLISDTLCMTTPVLDKCVKSIKEGMFTNKNYRKNRYLQTPRLLISTIHVKLNMFEKVFHWGYTIQK